MQHLASALWHGILGGAAARTRANATGPEARGYTSSVAQALYWLGFEVSNAVVHGPQKKPTGDA